MKSEYLDQQEFLKYENLDSNQEWLAGITADLIASLRK
jgi:hypothetical protein